MKKILSIIILVLAFLAGFFVFYRSKPASTPTTQNNQTQTANPEQNWPPQTDEQAAVTVTVTPTDLSSQSSEWKFDVSMNTHSVELNQDLTQVVVLTDGSGKEYKPIRWEGPTGGHHREGVLVFKAISPAPELITLKIKSIADVERSFTWQLH